MIILQFKTTNSSSAIISSWKTITNLRHRLHGKPAWQAWYANGQKYYEQYYEHGRKLHANWRT